MSLSKKIASNTILHTLGKFGGSAIGLIIIGVLTRYLGTDGYGQYTTVFAYLFFFATIGDLGLYLVTVNELGKKGIDQIKVFSNAFSMRFFSGIFLMLAANLLVWFFPYPTEIKLGTLIISISMLLMMSDQVLVAVFQQKMKTKYVAVAEITGKIIILFSTIWVVKNDFGFLAVLWTVVGGFTIHFLINLIYARKLIKFHLDFNWGVWESILKKSWPVATYMLFSMLYFKADTIILSLFHPASEVGLYGAPYKMLEVLIAFPAIFMGLVSPHLSKAWSDKKIENFKKYFQKAFDFLSFLTWPMIWGTLALSTPLVTLIAGKDFAQAGPILNILIIATGVIFMAHLSSFAVVAIEKQRKMLKYYIVAAVLALILYFSLIPTYSYWAAAGVTLLIELFILISSTIIVKQQTKLKINYSVFLKSFLNALIMYIILKILHLNLLGSILVAFLIYFSLAYILKAIDKKIILEFLKAKNNNKPAR